MKNVKLQSYEAIRNVCYKMHHCWVFHVTSELLRDHPLDVGRFFTIFDPYPPTVGSFLLLSVGKFGKFLTPSPLSNADVLNGWSLMLNFFLHLLPQLPSLGNYLEFH